MKVVITADIHLKDKLECPERYHALEDILRQAITHNISAVIIAGDLFDNYFKNYSDFEGLCQQYKSLDFHIIPGNHDADISGKNIVGSNIHIYSVPTLVDFSPTTFLFVPFDEGTKMADGITSEDAAIQNKEWVLISHGDYYGGTRQQNPLETGLYMPLSRPNVIRFKPRAVFLGHIHKATRIDNVCYVGSPCGMDISEVGKKSFVVYDTSSGSIVQMPVSSDVLYFDERFIIVPSGNEVNILKQDIARRIGSWNIDSLDYSKVVVRAQAVGYSCDRSAILSCLQEGFAPFKLYHGEEPKIDKLLVGGTDYRLDAIVGKAMKAIEELEWNFEGDEPTREMVKIEALHLIYGGLNK